VCVCALEAERGSWSWAFLYLPLAVAIIVVDGCLLVGDRAGPVHAGQGLDLDFRGVRAETAEVGRCAGLEESDVDEAWSLEGGAWFVSLGFDGPL
jgi:hypothetical protein